MMIEIINFVNICILSFINSLFPLINTNILDSNEVILLHGFKFLLFSASYPYKSPLIVISFRA